MRILLPQLISEIADAHILYKKCVVAVPKPFDDASRRKFLMEESIKINAAPGRPSLDCFVSVSSSLEC
jgi:serine carboxypeptidase-like clade 1